MKSTNSIADQIAGLVNPDTGKGQSPSDEDKRFIAEYSKGLACLSIEEQNLAFKNVIRNEFSSCGFAGGGAYQYLVNTDTQNRYQVTVRTYWRQGINAGSSDNPPPTREHPTRLRQP